jgi:hypothetical protein
MSCFKIDKRVSLAPNSGGTSLMAETSNRIEIDRHELAALIQRVEEAIEHDLALSVEDMKLLLSAISTLCTLQEKMESKDVTLRKLQKLLGMVQQSEKRPGDKKNKSSSSSAKKRSADKKRRQGKHKPPKIEHHKITDYQRGQSCPECLKGKLYKHEPAQLLRVTGHARYEAIKHVRELLRCNVCQKLYKAPLPQAVLDDGAENQMYGYSARSLMAIDKFYSGLPYYHQENLADIFGHAISASTIFDQCELVSNAIMPVFYELYRQAANAYGFMMDDTSNRILEQQPEMRDKPNGKGKVLRTGIYSSGLIAQLEDSHEILLFKTSLGHAGEHLDKILEKRKPSLPPPLIMSDALSSNSITKAIVNIAYCNSHARRQFVDVESLHPEDVGWVLDTYAIIWQSEEKVRELNMDADKRLAYHKKHSWPAMEKIRQWAEKKQSSDAFEQNSAYGRAINYFLRHYQRLTLFCQMKGALIDNNRMEEKLKIVIRGRKTAHFYKTAVGAAVANVLLSLIATAHTAKINIYDYLLALQKQQKQVKQAPECWLPWNYQQMLDAEPVENGDS